MADVNPFRGLRYDLGQVGELSDVTAPPYDVISPATAEGTLRAASVQRDPPDSQSGRTGRHRSRGPIQAGRPLSEATGSRSGF